MVIWALNSSKREDRSLSKYWISLFSMIWRVPGCVSAVLKDIKSKKVIHLSITLWIFIVFII